MVDNTTGKITDNAVVPVHSTVTSRTIMHLRGKYIKRQLTQLESHGMINSTVRKIILDAMNDFTRELEKELGIV